MPILSARRVISAIMTSYALYVFSMGMTCVHENRRAHTHTHTHTHTHMHQNLYGNDKCTHSIYKQHIVV